MKYGIIVFAVLFSCAAGTSFASTPPDPVKYSYKIWPRGKIRKGQTASAKTPFGVLTCSGGGGYNEAGIQVGAPSPRSCHW